MGVFLYISLKDVGGFFTGSSENEKIEFCP